MVPVMSLWLPILVAAVIVFVVSSVIHMALGYHSGDQKAVPRQDDVQAALRPFAIPPGDYALPRAATMKEMGTPEFIDRLKKGPVMLLTVAPSQPFTMGPSLLQWFVYSIVVGAFAAYVTGRALGPGADYLAVFRLSGTTAFVGYALALAQMSIWYRRSWRTTFVTMFDGLIYGLCTAGAFGWLWPK